MPRALNLALCVRVSRDGNVTLACKAVTEITANILPAHRQQFIIFILKELLLCLITASQGCRRWFTVKSLQFSLGIVPVNYRDEFCSLGLVFQAF